jgi:hypothetical protein
MSIADGNREFARPYAATGWEIGLWWAALGVTLLAVLAPLLVTDIPPLLDYPNHLARMGLISGGLADPILGKMYAVGWGIQPNIGLDLVVPLLTAVMPLAVAGKIFVGLALVLPMAGAIALNAALFGRRSYWPLAAALVAYNVPFMAGFVNFVVGAGIGLLAAALFVRQRGRTWPVRFGWAALFGIAIFFCHIFAFVYFVMLLASVEFAWPGRLVQRVSRLGWLAVPLAVPVLLFLLAPLRHAAPGANGGGILQTVRVYYWSLASEPLHMKLLGAFGPFLTYDRRLDGLALAVTLLALASWAIRGKLAVAPAAAIGFVVMVVAYPLTPLILMDAAWVDQREPILAAILLFAGAAPIRLRQTEARGWAVVFAVLILVKLATVGVAWAQHDADLADFRRVIAPVQPGERVLIVRPDDHVAADVAAREPATRHLMVDVDALMHLPSLIVLERHGFIPLLFTDPLKQPLRVLPPYDRLAMVDGAPPFASALAGPSETDLRRAPYLVHWQDDFDWVLLLRPHDLPDASQVMPAPLELVVGGEVAALYRVHP